jgi:hypothetical protein
MNFDPTVVNSIVLIGTAFAAAFLATLWLSLIIWTFRDIRKRSRDPFARITAVLVVAVLFLPGLLIYTLLRPAKTLEDEYQQTLEEEALLQTIEDIPLCPGCTRKVQPTWIVCPSCQTKLKKKCSHCNMLLELPWNICPFCATEVPDMIAETADEGYGTLITSFDENPEPLANTIEDEGENVT